MKAVADSAVGWGGEKHDIYAAAFGSHLFDDLFLQGQGSHATFPPPPDPLLERWWRNSFTECKLITS